MNAKTIADITPYNLRKLLDFLQLLEDQINVDGYSRLSLSRCIVLSISIIENRGIVPDEIRATIKLINNIKNEKILSIVNDDLISKLEPKPSYLFESDYGKKQKQEKIEKETEANIEGWLRFRSRKNLNRQNFDKHLIIEILNHGKFDEFKKDIATHQEDEVHFELRNQTIEFDQTKQIIKVAEKRCQLPPYKNEYYLAKVMFNIESKIPVEWVEIAKEMTGKDLDNLDAKKDQRTVNDTVGALNERVQRDMHTSDKLFKWKNKSVIRNY